MSENKKEPAELTAEQMKDYCLANGVSLEQLKQLLKFASIEEIYLSIKNKVEGGEYGTSSAFSAKRATEFGDDKTEFAWFPYLPIGDYTVLMADGGTGKTILCCGIIAALSKGEILPGEVIEHLPSNTLFISAEDRGELLKKRLKASGADLNKVYIVDCMDSEGLDFTNGYEEFAELIRRYEPKLVIMDPWHAFLGASVDINRVNAVRPVFQSLANIAKSCNCAMILVSHINKRAQGENANNAATGSTDFVNAARSAIRVVFSDEDGEDNVRILIHTKSNYAAAGKSIKYRINENGGLEWAGFSDITRKTLEKAARRKQTPGEFMRNRKAEEDNSEQLFKAICERAIEGDIVRMSYDELKELYGENIFGNMQPKRALDSIRERLQDEANITLNAGRKIKSNGVSKNGFAFYKEQDTGQIEF